MSQIIGILLGLSACASLLVGSLIVFKTKNNDKVVTFSVSIGLIVLVLLVVFHLLPECLHILKHTFNNIKSFAYLFLMVLTGMLLLKVLDRFVPHHHGEDESDVLSHVAVVTCIALFIHNFIEGMALYTATLSSIKSGVLLAIGVGLHNIPLGLTVTSGFYKENKSVKRTFIYIFLLGLSTFLGAIFASLFTSISSHNIVTASILGLTIGMIIYIVCFELWHIFKHSKHIKIKIAGAGIGAIVMLITTIV